MFLAQKHAQISQFWRVAASKSHVALPNDIWRCRMAPGVAVWPLALPDGHWRCRMTGRCRLSRGVARHPRALPWGVAVRHLALPGGTWRCRNASKARQVLGLGRAGLQPRTNTSSFLTFRDVLHEWSHLTFRSKIQSRFCCHNHKLTCAVKIFLPDLRHAVLQ